MVLLFTFWYLLGWQFPTWLWVIAGIFFLAHLSNKSNRKHKASGFVNNSVGLPLSLALGLVYGSLPDGSPILPDGMGWTVLFILIASGIISGGVSYSSDSKSKRKSKEIKSTIEVSPESSTDGEGIPGRKLRIKVVEDGEDTTNILLNLKLINMFGKFIPGKARKRMSAKGIDFDAILELVKQGADVGILAEVQDDDEHVIISIE